MNYKKIYDSLMESRFKLKSEREIKRKDKIERYEIHHIIPRTLHGTNSEENLIILTLREHFMSHYMLHKIYGGRMSYAFKAMCDFKRYKDYTISAREYEKLKTLFANTISEFTKKRFENPNARIYLSEFQKTLWETDSEYKRKRLEFLKSDEKRKATSDGVKNWIANNNEVFQEKMDKINHDPEKIRKMAEKHRGMKRSDASKLNMSESKKRFIAENGTEFIGKGCKYSHNPITGERKRVKADAILPEGWLWGMGKQDKQKPKGVNIYIKNEITKKEKCVPKNTEIPVGWEIGRLKRNG